MKNIIVNCKNIQISNNNKLCLIAGPCQLETEQHAMDMAGKIKEIAKKFNIGFIYKTSFDKANRTSQKGKRGAGLEKSLPVFDKIKKELKVPILTDIHNEDQCSIVADHVDILQIPAFLCRQTDLLIAAGKTNKIIKGTRKDLGGTMRLGLYEAKLKHNSMIKNIYKEASIKERHRHRYEVNNNLKNKFEEKGMIFSGMSPDNLLPEIIELKNHPWFIGVQFHPEFKSRPLTPHPLFSSFIKAAKFYNDK